MTLIEKIKVILKKSSIIPYFVLLIVSLIFFFQFKNNEIMPTHDGGLHLKRIIGVMQAIQEKQFPPIISPYFANGFGYALNLFYNPITTFLPLLIKLYTASYAEALKYFAFFTIWFSGITMYHFVKQVTNRRKIALLSGILYIAVPYKLMDIYVRFAIGEFTAFVFIPILFMGLYNLLKQDGKRHYLITIGAVGLFLSHTITTLYIAILAFIFVICFFRKAKAKDIIYKLGINLLFVIAISMLYIGPMLQAKMTADYAIFEPEYMNAQPSTVHKKAIDLSQLVLDKENSELTYRIGIPILVCTTLCFVVQKKIRKEERRFYYFSLVAGIFLLFMATNYFPWTYMPELMTMIQFPWRTIGIAVFFLAYVGSVNFYLFITRFFKDSKKENAIIILFSILTVLSILPIFKNLPNEHQELDQDIEKYILDYHKIGIMAINREYLPAKSTKVNHEYIKSRDDKIHILQGKTEIRSQEKQELIEHFQIENTIEETTIELPFIFYPGYEAILNQKQEIEVRESENGFVCIQIPEGTNGEIVVSYKGTIWAKLSYFISFIGIIVFIVYIRRSKKHEVTIKT